MVNDYRAKAEAIVLRAANDVGLLREIETLLVYAAMPAHVKVYRECGVTPAHELHQQLTDELKRIVDIPLAVAQKLFVEGLINSKEEEVPAAD